MLFYLTPIIYPLSTLLDKYEIGKFVLLNPLAQIIQDLRYILVTPQTQTAWQQLGMLSLVPPLLIVVISIYAVWYFKKESKTFAENV